MTWRSWLCVFAALLIAGCGQSPASRPSPSHGPSPPIGSPSPAPSPTPPALAAGAPAWVSVSVASGWRSPQSPRAVDAPALENPARVREWIAGMTIQDQTGLIDRLDTQLLLGDEVDVLELKGGWARVVVPDQATPLDSRGYPVWLQMRQLTAEPPMDTGQLVTVTAPTARLFAGTTALEVSYGTRLPVLGRDSATYSVGLPDGRVMTVAAGSVAALPATASAAAVIAAARGMIGVPYLWGGTSGFGFDCSGLAHVLYKANGITVPRDSDPQSKVGVVVARADLQPGDLVFFASGGVAYHVAIYVGSGLVVEAPGPGEKVMQSALSSMPVAPDYSGARRLISPEVQPSPAPSPRSTPARLPATLSGAEWTRLPTTDKVVALSFDAGGNNAGVAAILQALRENGVPATFFLTGRWTEVYPADARKIAATYGIGNHTYSHPRLTDLTDAQVNEQITHAATVIKSTTGRDSHPLFRFPYGSSNARVLADAHAVGYGGIRWTVDTLGWEGRSNGQSEATVLGRVLGSLQPGEIVLMHVGAANDSTTLDALALPSIIRQLQARGYRMVLITDYVK